MSWCLCFHVAQVDQILEDHCKGAPQLLAMETPQKSLRRSISFYCLFFFFHSLPTIRFKRVDSCCKNEIDLLKCEILLFFQQAEFEKDIVNRPQCERRLRYGAKIRVQANY